MTPYRRALLREAVVEAARQYLAAYLRHERYGTPDLHEMLDHLQTLRDALAAERRGR